LISQLDAAIVAAPTQFHHPIVLDLVRRSIHVFVEKPLAANAEQAEELVLEARRFNALLQVGHVERFNPALVAARPLLRDPKFIQAARWGGYSGRSTDIGVVLDLMIHDLDVVLSLVQSPLASVEALGMGILGPHEDVAQAWLRFECGCIASLSASRISYLPQRTMHVWSQEAFASLDFSAKKATLVRPTDQVRQRRLDVAALPPCDRAAFKDRLFTDYLVREDLTPPPCDQLTDELEDFVTCIRRARMPRVTGEQARQAIVVAERVLASIAEHAWDGQHEGRHGPLASPVPYIVPLPQWYLDHAATRKKVG
jgi:predicted dehydrogenase